MKLTRTFVFAILLIIIAVADLPVAIENALGQTEIFSIDLVPGINLLSVPLHPDEEWRMSDLLAFIGPEALQVIYYDTTGSQFKSYLPNYDVDAPLNVSVRGGEGYIVVMRSAKMVTFEGREWDGTVSLQQGINMISVPLEPSEEWRMSDVLAFIGPEALQVIYYDTTGSQFKSYLPNYDVDVPLNVPVRGGEGYILIMSAPKIVKFEGSTWKNPTGTTIYNSDKTFNGYTIYTDFQTIRKNEVWLIDMQGNIVHSWKGKDVDLRYYAEPLSNGNLLVLARQIGQSRLGGVVELDWDGNTVWKYFVDAEDTHHDIERLENGNTLLLSYELRLIPKISPKIGKDDFIIEVNPEGEIVWEWYTSEHFDEFGFSADAKELIAEHGGDWSHTNSIQSLPDNSLGDTRFRKGNILVSQRHTNIIFIIDKDSGQIVWKIDPDENLTIGQHDAKMIEEGFSGAGNILVFDNGGIAGYPQQYRSYSRVIEIDPVSKEVVWEYTATKSGLPRETFFSSLISGAQRLLNGNTLINEGMNGRFFEITREGEIVWEYINPFFLEWNEESINRVYRIWRVPLSWVVLK